ncbi:MAG: 30S ribosomal protein S20 [Eubacteriales bacterium]|jgi:small subunit ribosomal protein S20|nr:30S ribosomal protein S20 [Eubacteriales bacterium]
MANSKTALKRVKINEVKRARNVSAKSSIKTNIRKYETALTEGNADTATALYSKISSMLDKAANKGIIHKNAAARRKSRLAAKM